MNHTLAYGDYGLPEGVSLSHTLAMLCVIGVVTVALRAFPFPFIARLRGSDFVAHFSRTMPVGVTMVLIVYTAVETSHDSGGWWPVLVAIAGTCLLHAWRHSVTLSIFGGTALYVLLLNVVA